MRLVGLSACLLIYWLALSGHYTPFLITMGVCSIALVLWFSVRIGIIDGEGQPFELLIAAVTYWPWLIVEIYKSALSVTRILISPSLPISPTMTRVIAKQRTSAGLATYANSITLTPGTITTHVNGAELIVHAITEGGAIDLEGGEMDARVKKFEGQR
ncbi:MAG: Na+/H+ antiporter subunit E [Pseudomonadota bacterium]